MSPARGCAGMLFLGDLVGTTKVARGKVRGETVLLRDSCLSHGITRHRPATPTAPTACHPAPAARGAEPDTSTLPGPHPVQRQASLGGGSKDISHLQRRGCKLHSEWGILQP